MSESVSEDQTRPKFRKLFFYAVTAGYVDAICVLIAVFHNPEWHTHLLRLTQRTWFLFVTKDVGSTGRGFINSTIVPLLAILVVVGLIWALQGLEAMKAHIAENAAVALVAIVTVLLVVYGSQFAWEVARMTFEDHQGLVAANEGLVDPKDRDAQIESLKKQLGSMPKNKGLAPSQANPSTVSSAPRKSVFPSPSSTSPASTNASNQTTANQEVKDTIEIIEDMDRRWTNQILAAQKGSSGYQRHPSEDKDEQEKQRKQADKEFAESVVRQDDQIRTQFEKSADSIGKSNSDAIRRMNLPGQQRLTPNQIRDYNLDFNKAIETARKSENSENLNQNRFALLKSYFLKVQTKLGEYSEMTVAEVDTSHPQ
jgi:hypothetical protein